jgi:hypothetical protein
MQESDWADKIAQRVNRTPCKTVGDREVLIARALRRARAYGMRDVAIAVAEKNATNKEATTTARETDQ